MQGVPINTRIRDGLKIVCDFHLMIYEKECIKKMYALRAFQNVFIFKIYWFKQFLLVFNKLESRLDIIVNLSVNFEVEIDRPYFGNPEASSFRFKCFNWDTAKIVLTKSCCVYNKDDIELIIKFPWLLIYQLSPIQGVQINMGIERRLEYRLWFPIIDK